VSVVAGRKSSVGHWGRYSGVGYSGKRGREKKWEERGGKRRGVQRRREGKGMGGK
jgi:hypothetical protein